MSVNQDSIRLLVRVLINDNEESTSDIFSYNISTVFTLTESNVNSITEVLINEVATTSYTFDSTTSRISITASLNTGDTIEVRYKYYCDYSDSELEKFIEAALVFISVNKYKDFVLVSGGDIWPEPDINEKNLIAMVTSLIIKPDNKTLKLPDITVVAPKDLPTHEKIARFIAMFKSAKTGTFEIRTPNEC